MASPTKARALAIVRLTTLGEAASTLGERAAAVSVKPPDHCAPGTRPSAAGHGGPEPEQAGLQNFASHAPLRRAFGCHLRSGSVLVWAQFGDSATTLTAEDTGSSSGERPRPGVMKAPGDAVGEGWEGIGWVWASRLSHPLQLEVTAQPPPCLWPSDTRCDVRPPGCGV